MKSTGPSIVTNSVTSWLMNLNSGCPMCSMFSSDPVSRLSMQITSSPSSIRNSHRCDPRKPAPPVTTQTGMAWLPYQRPEFAGCVCLTGCARHFRHSAAARSRTLQRKARVPRDRARSARDIGTPPPAANPCKRDSRASFVTLAAPAAGRWATWPFGRMPRTIRRSRNPNQGAEGCSRTMWAASGRLARRKPWNGSRRRSRSPRRARPPCGGTHGAIRCARLTPRTPASADSRSC